VRHQDNRTPSGDNFTDCWKGCHDAVVIGNLKLLETASAAIKKAKELGINLLIPSDTIAADAFSNDAARQLCPVNIIPDNMMGLDIGPETVKAFSEVIMKSKTILWNGPMGVFEFSNFEQGTKEVALAIAAATTKGCFSLVGGGDSVAAVGKYHLADKVIGNLKLLVEWHVEINPNQSTFAFQVE
jgi:3-phosphoglycerate kinase